MSKRIYVGNLPYAASDDELASIFSEYGTVEYARVAIDRETGRSKGFAFVDLSNDEDALKAIDALHGADYKGRTIVVNEARPREERSSGPRSFQRPGGSYGR